MSDYSADASTPSGMLTSISYGIAQARSGGHCEAMINVGDKQYPNWCRCGVQPTEIHHRLTRARGGTILDQYGEAYHLMALCRKHHNTAHDQSKAFDNGLLIDGYVVTKGNMPSYTGSDEYLNERYGE